MDIPTLKMADGYSAETNSFQRMLGRQDGEFVKAYHKSLKDAEQCRDEFVSKAKAELTASNKDVAKEICEHANRDMAFMRGWAANALQDYLLSHDGTVDQWPDSATGDYLSMSDFSGSQYYFIFDYFGDDYVCRDGKIQRSTSKLVYRNAYTYSSTDELRRLDSKKVELKNKERSCDNQREIIAHFLCTLGLFYCTLAVLTVLGNMFWGTHGWISQFILNVTNATQGAHQTSLQKILHGVLTILALPSAAHWLIALLPSHGVFYWILTLTLLGMCICGALYCYSRVKQCRAAQKVWKQAARELRQFEESAEYKQAKAEDETVRRQYEAFAEEWQRAWYNWLCGEKKEVIKIPNEDSNIIHP